MKTEFLLAAVLLSLSIPWIVAAAGSDTVGMYADPRHALLERDSDVYDCMWHYRWVQQCASNRTDPRVYYGRTLAWNNMGWPDLMLSLLFGYGYDTSLLIGTMFSAVAGYLLARAWGLSRNGALLAGLIVAWMPVRSIRTLQHYSIASLGYALMSLAMIRRILTDGRKRYLALAFVFSALAVAESLQNGLTIALGWLITVLLIKWKGAGRTALSALIPAFGCIAGAVWLFTSPGLTGIDPGKDWREAVFWGAEIQSYFLPSLLGKAIVTGYMPNPFEGVVTPGLSVMLLGTFWCIREKQWKAAAAALAVMILSVGPLFKFMGVPTPLPLPYMLIAKTPWLSAARTPARLGIIVGIMAALGSGAILERSRKATGWLITCLVMIELTPVFLPKIESTVPSFYRSRSDAELILEIPANTAIRRYSLFEAADGIRRRVKFFTRGGEDMMEGIPEGLHWASETPPSRDDLESTGADVVVYNRWMFTGNTRSHYDSLYSSVFTPDEKGDSLWIWKGNDNSS